VTQPARRHRTFFLLVPLLLALVVAGLGAVSALRKIESYQPLGFEARLDGGAWLVGMITNPATGLVTGDRILLVDGMPRGAAAELRRELAGQERTRLSVLRGAELVEVRYKRPPLEVDFRYLLLAAAAIVYLGVGLFTASRRRDGLGFLFFLWCLASAVIYLFTVRDRAYDGVGMALEIGEQLARLLLPPLTLHLFLVFPSPLGERWRGRVLPWLYLPAAVLAVLQVDLMFFNGRWVFGQATAQAVQRLDDLGLLSLGVFVLAAFGTLVYRLRRTREPDGRGQLSWITLGVGAGYLPFVALYLLPRAFSWTPPDWVTDAAVMPLALVPLAFAYAILRYKLWDMGLIVRNTIASTLTLLLAVLGFSVVNLMLSRGLPEHLAEARSVLTFVAGIAVAGLSIPARRGIGSALERVHYRGSFGRRRLLADLGRELLHERDLDTLCASLLDHLDVALGLERSNLYLAQGAALVPARPQMGEPRELAYELLDEKGWAAEVTGISGLGGLDGGADPALALYSVGYRYAFPLTVRDHRVGLLVTSYKHDQSPLNSEDIELARQLLNQAALALENAQLLDRLQQQLQEVVRLERYNEGIIQSSPAGIAVISSDGIVRSSNLAFAALVGRERRRVLGEPLAQLLPAVPRSSGQHVIQLEGGAHSERHLQVGLAPLEGDAEGLSILVVQDISERVRLENELREKDRLASLGMLAAGVAHEVNTPITGISSYAQMLLEDTPEDDPRHGLLKKVERQTFRASQIVRSLLDFARQRRGEQREVTLAEVAEEAVSEFEHRYRDRGLELVWQRPAEASLRVLGSETELTQVVVNLLANALDATHPGGRVEVGVAERDDRALLWVADNGSGIPREQIERIFQPFFSTKLAEGGTGLGLSISYEIVRRHGGRMTVESEPGQGSRFTVSLPGRSTVVTH
jgi:two-component system, NtrC family, sensor kinase